MRIWAHVGSWEMPDSWNKELPFEQILSGSLKFHPIQLQQIVVPQKSVKQIGASYVNVSGGIADVKRNSWQLDAGTLLKCEESPYSWLFEGQFIEGIGSISIDLSTDNQVDQQSFILKKVWSDLKFFSRLQVTHNRLIQKGTRSPDLGRSINSFLQSNPPYEIQSISESKFASGINHFCLELETELS